ncbi:hypothetical protein BMF77_01351 [Dolichospermum sp. UHCC 0315A]|jgi:hypothetical protein|nr:MULTISPECIES: hypothetical protein [Nostocales]AFW94334.1 hypothetical protein ANA_C11560 [Anabaena sp. 90]MDB9439283.1 hypothetical protein [Dolichospermum lemmermannii CS-548]MTJ17553.1 hypothetical protein [Dolichospermum sp. UHCC 0299]MTJ21309.1 hypothetical protein [Dolichospermum sp. UHCC 0352]MTJ39760.1 hypothetical protein [Dolichospermum sp. UHCC 0406]
MPKKINFQSRKFPKAVTFSLYLFGVMAVLIVSFPWLYEIKTKAGINISKKYNTGSFLEKHTHGLFKCQWLYPYHCKPPQD